MTALEAPTPDTFTRSVDSPIDPTIDTDGRTVTVRLVPWNSPRQVADARRRYTESFARGGLAAVPGPLPIYVEKEHGGPVIGVINPDDLEDRTDGLYAPVRISRSSAGNDMLADLSDRIYRYVSVDFYDAPVPAGATNVTRSAAMLRRVAFTLEPQHDAPVVSIRSNLNPESEPPMSDEITAPVVPAPPVPTVNAADAEIVTRSRPTIDTPAPATLPHRFESFGHFTRAVALGEFTGPDLERYQRALADVITTDITGMVREQWVDEIIDLRRNYAPTLDHWRRRPLPSKGMSFSQPVVATRPTIGNQATQKTDITSTDVVMDLVQWPIKTYAGGNDVSIQALTRAEPELLAELMRLYAVQMNLGLNTAAVTKLVADAAVGVSGNTALEYVDAETFDELVIDASAGFMQASALRRPADMIALSVDLWAALGKAKDLEGRPLYPSINPLNASGVVTARRDEGTMVEVGWYVEPDLGTGIKGVIGVQDAFVSALGPVGTLTADVPSKLGRDVAVYQEAAFGATDASGLVQIVNAS